MPTVPHERPQSFQEFVALIEKLQVGAGRSLWYRGCGRSSYELSPSLFRHRDKKRQQDLLRLEEQLMLRFRQRSIPLLSRPLGDDWDTLFFMQHYGIPTRLLDWTENPFISFYFALMSAEFRAVRSKGARTRTLKFKEDAAVWVLDPVVWNAHALRFQSFNRGVLSTTDEALNPYRPPAMSTDERNLPLAIYGAYNSPRIVAQRGAFTIFGHNRTAMETLYDSNAFPPSSLTQIVLDKELLAAMRRSILNHGITESVVFPDLDGLAKEMKRNFEFED